MLIGLIADTHGYLDPRMLPALRGVDLILHAGDIGAEGVLTALASIAPVTAVAGNNDAKLAQLGLPLRVDVDLEGVRIHLVHRLIDAAPGPDARVVAFAGEAADDAHAPLHLAQGTLKEVRGAAEFTASSRASIRRFESIFRDLTRWTLRTN